MIAQGSQIRYVLRPCPTPMPKSFALLKSRLIGGVTSRGDAVVPAQTTPMRAIAAKHERGSGGFLRGSGVNCQSYETTDLSSLPILSEFALPLSPPGRASIKAVCVRSAGISPAQCCTVEQSLQRASC